MRGHTRVAATGSAVVAALVAFSVGAAVGQGGIAAGEAQVPSPLELLSVEIAPMRGVAQAENGAPSADPGTGEAAAGAPAIETWIGTDIQLDLATDHGFVARGLDGGDRIGRWGQDGFEITLQDDRGTVVVGVADDGTLRLPGGAVLRRAPAAPPLEPRLHLRGSFVYFPDAARFTECLTGRGYDVAMQGDYLALERAYSATRREPAEPVIATLDGRLGLAPAIEGGGFRPTLFVERFDQMWPRETCGTPFATASFTETWWALTRLDGQPVTAEMFQTEPHLVFLEEGGRFAGSGGCNRVAGTWRADGTTLTLMPGPMTMMACERGMDTERRLVDLMRRAQGYRIAGSHLELVDAAGNTLVRAEQRLMP
jgi:copper homeostasis protein (lipoprotein)